MSRLTNIGSGVSQNDCLDAYKFCDLLSTSELGDQHADLVHPISTAVDSDDSDAVAKIAADKLGLHFTGAELKQVTSEVGHAVDQVNAATVAGPFAAVSSSFAVGMSPDGTMTYSGSDGPGGVTFGFPGSGLPGGASLGLKVMLQLLARQMKAKGDSDATIRAALMTVAGGAQGGLGQAIDGSSPTPSDIVNDVMKSVASVVTGGLQGVVSEVPKIINRIFSGW